MNTLEHIIDELEKNRLVFKDLLHNISDELCHWRPAPNKWDIHEIACHLLDGERDDFRVRIQSVLEDPKKPFVPIDPEGWPISRKYAEQDYQSVLEQFDLERTKSVAWLKTQAEASWGNTYIHDEFGAMTARQFLHNWLAHDYLHIRQINRYKYEYFSALSGESLNYTGNW